MKRSKEFETGFIFVHFVFNVRTEEKQIQANRNTQTYFNGGDTILINLLIHFYPTPIVL